MRFQGANSTRSFQLIDAVRRTAREFGVAPSQTALARVLAQGDDVIAIPGTKHVARLEENAAAAAIVLSPEQSRAPRLPHRTAMSPASAAPI